MAIDQESDGTRRLIEYMPLLYAVLKSDKVFVVDEIERSLHPIMIKFAQKDVDQATQLYPLSDYNVHNTANIENGYLNGRYGGIPFLSNLSDLKW